MFPMPARLLSRNPLSLQASRLVHPFSPTRDNTRGPLAPAYQSQLVAGVDTGADASFLGQHHLAPFVNGNDGLDLVGDPAVTSGGETFPLLLTLSGPGAVRNQWYQYARIILISGRSVQGCGCDLSKAGTVGGYAEDSGHYMRVPACVAGFGIVASDSQRRSEPRDHLLTHPQRRACPFCHEPPATNGSVGSSCYIRIDEYMLRYTPC